MRTETRKEEWITDGALITKERRESLIALLSKGLRVKNKGRMRSILTYNLSDVIYYLDRFYFVEDEVHYCAGQSYPCEMSYIKKQILK